MRRSLTTAALATATIALAGACGTGTQGRTAAVSAAPGASATPSRSPDPSAVNTHQVCGAINQAVADGTAALGTDLGTMVGHLAGANPAEADAAKKAAVRRLTDLAAAVRSAAEPAMSPRVRNAAQTTAGNLDRVASDPALLDGVKTTADVTPVLTRVTGTVDPMANVCA